MSAIATSGASSGLSAVAQLLNNGASQTKPGTAQAPQSPASDSSTASPDETGPAAFVTLSDHAKAAAAARLKSDQVAAASLQAFVEAHRVSNTNNGAKISANGAKASSVGILQIILDANTQSTVAQSADTQSATSVAKVDAIVTQITTLASADEPPPFQPFTPTKSLSNSLTVDGFTLTLSTNALTQFSGFDLSGNGIEAFTDHFGPSAGAGGSRGVSPGVEISSENSIDNNEAEDSITITRNVAAASSASISSSSAGSVSASAVSAQSSSITFLVNYATGQISAKETAVAVSAQSTQFNPPGSTVSTLA